MGLYSHDDYRAVRVGLDGAPYLTSTMIRQLAACPTCGAPTLGVCVEISGEPRASNHLRRLEAAVTTWTIRYGQWSRGVEDEGRPDAMFDVDAPVTKPSEKMRRVGGSTPQPKTVVLDAPKGATRESIAKAIALSDGWTEERWAVAGERAEAFLENADALLRSGILRVEYITYPKPEPVRDPTRRSMDAEEPFDRTRERLVGWDEARRAVSAYTDRIGAWEPIGELYDFLYSTTPDNWRVDIRRV